MRHPYLPTLDTAQAADVDAVADRVCGQLGGRICAVLDGNFGAECWDFRVTSDLYHAVCGDGGSLVVVTCSGSEGRVRSYGVVNRIQPGGRRGGDVVALARGRELESTQELDTQ